MAWSVGAFGANTAGFLVAKLDVLLPANPFWSIYDTPAANVRVYECIDLANACLFYVYVDNTAAGFGVVQLWEGWNAGAHSGIGAFLTFIGTSVSLKMTYGVGGYGISVRDHCFTWIDFAGKRGSYIGQPRRRDPTLNIVVYCGAGGTPGAVNPLGYFGVTVTSAWASLFDELGNKVAIESNGLAGTVEFITILGEVEIKESVIYGVGTRKLLGELEGVCTYSSSIGGILNGDTCLMPGGNTWRAMFNTYLSFIEEA